MTLLAARRDGGGSVRESERPPFVDEVQRAGDPFILAVKAAVITSEIVAHYPRLSSSLWTTSPSHNLANTISPAHIRSLASGCCDAATTAQRIHSAIPPWSLERRLHLLRHRSVKPQTRFGMFAYKFTVAHDELSIDDRMGG